MRALSTQNFRDFGPLPLVTVLPIYDLDERDNTVDQHATILSLAIVEPQANRPFYFFSSEQFWLWRHQYTLLCNLQLLSYCYFPFLQLVKRVRDQGLVGVLEGGGALLTFLTCISAWYLTRSNIRCARTTSVDGKSHQVIFTVKNLQRSANVDAPAPGCVNAAGKLGQKW